MPHVPPLTDEHASEPARQLFHAVESQFGMVPNIFRTMAHNPDVLEAVLKLNSAVQQDLPPKFRELAYLRASLLNGCSYCAHHHRQAALAAGISEHQVEAIQQFEGSDAFDHQEQAVLRFAEQLTATTEVDEDTVAQIQEFLTDSQFVTLTAVVGLANFTNRFNHACGVELP